MLNNFSKLIFDNIFDMPIWHIKKFFLTILLKYAQINDQYYTYIQVLDVFKENI